MNNSYGGYLNNFSVFIDRFYNIIENSLRLINIYEEDVAHNINVRTYIHSNHTKLMYILISLCLVLVCHFAASLLVCQLAPFTFHNYRIFYIFFFFSSNTCIVTKRIASGTLLYIGYLY